MTDPKSWVATTYLGLADLLAGSALDAWDHPSLCQGWQVRHVVAHMTMPARMTPQDFGIEMAAAGGNFQVLSDKVAARDASLPLTELLDQLRSAQLHEWLPPGGGLAGAVSHAVIHSLDITIAIDRPSVAPTEAEIAVVDQLTEARGALFGVDFNDLQLPRQTPTGLGAMARRSQPAQASWSHSRRVASSRTAGTAPQLSFPPSRLRG